MSRIAVINFSACKLWYKNHRAMFASDRPYQALRPQRQFGHDTMPICNPPDDTELPDEEFDALCDQLIKEMESFGVHDDEKNGQAF